MVTDFMLQVITANIGGHRNLRTDAINPQQTAQQIRQNLTFDPTQPSLIALQEVVQIRFADGHLHDLGEWVARELGADYRAYFAPKTSTANHPNVCVWDIPSYDGAEFVSEGNAILTNLPISQWAWGASVPFSVSIGRPRFYSTGNRDTEPRNLIALPVQTAYGTVYFMGTHLSTLRGEDRQDTSQSIAQEAQSMRLMEIEHILALLNELRQAEITAGIEPSPCILAGDFNSNASRPEIQRLLAQFTQYQPETPHYTHINHQIDIDHIFVSDPLHKLPPVQDVRVITEHAIPDISDHFLKIAIFNQHG